MQAPDAPYEDSAGGFGHGGWALPYNDEVQARVMGHSWRVTAACSLAGVPMKA